VKRLISVIVLLYVICTYLLSADEPNQGIVTGQLVPVYEQADVKSKKLMTLSKNIKFTILKQQKGWYYIKVNNKSGWIENTGTVEVVEEKLKKDVEEIPVETQEKEEEGTVIIYNKNESNNYDNDRQEINQPLRIGVRIGANLSKVTGIDAPSTVENRFGITGGGLIILNLYKGLCLHGELLYNQKGFIQGDTISKIDYFSLPILLGYHFNFGKISPYVNAGIELSYNINKGLVTPDETYVYDDIKQFDTGITFGAGLGYYINSKNSIILDLRYIMGISTIHDKTVHDVEEMDLKNNVISFSIGYIF